MFVDNALEANPVAGFLTLTRNFVQGSPVNQDSLVRTNAIATLSYLLQKVIKVMARLKLYYFGLPNMWYLIYAESIPSEAKNKTCRLQWGFV